MTQPIKKRTNLSYGLWIPPQIIVIGDLQLNPCWVELIFLDFCSIVGVPELGANAIPEKTFAIARSYFHDSSGSLQTVFLARPELE